MTSSADIPGANSGFWASAVSEPKRKYRFSLNVANIPLWTITKVKRPSFKITESSHTFYNHKFNYPGRVEWDPVTFTTLDPINPDATALLLKMLSASGYEFPDKQFGGDSYTFNSVNKVSSVDALNPVVINAFDAEGNSVEKWTLKNAFISSVDMGEYDYTSVDMMNIQVTLKYDWATIENINNRAFFQPSLDAAEIPDEFIGP
jgi:hypothetical protein